MKKLLLISLLFCSPLWAQTPVVPSDKDGSGSRPVPDPTVLTTEQIRREILSLREIIDGKLHGFEKAIDAIQKNLDSRQTAIDKTVDKLQELQNEKFVGVEKQFKERDVRTDKMAELNQKAIDAAFQAAKLGVEEQNKSNAAAISKSEGAFTKQIDAIVNLIAANGKSTDDKFSDVKTRLTLIEGRSTGQTDLWGWLFGAFGMLIAAGSLIAALVLLRRPQVEHRAPSK